MGVLLPPPYTETERINRIIEQGGKGLTDLEFFALELNAWLKSPLREEQLLGDRYYRGYQDILERERRVIGPDGSLQPVKNLPNNRLVDNQYANLADQKVNYLLGKPLTIDGKNKEYIAKLWDTLGKGFPRMLHRLGKDALCGTMGWLYPYYDEKGKFRLKRFPPFDILPFWADDEHTILDCALRYYRQEVWEGYSKKMVERVELYRQDGLYRYIRDGYSLRPDTELGEYSAYFTVTEASGRAEGYNWERIPLIPFRYNAQEIPLLRRVKSLQDALNLCHSDLANNMQEDKRNTIFVLKEYDGQDLGEFRRNLTELGAVKVRGDGGVETLDVQVNGENYQQQIQLLKKALIENGRGFDAKDERMSGNPNKMNIQSMYADIDLDANEMEVQFQGALQELRWFVDQHLKNRTGVDYSGEDVRFLFNRDVLINETEAIQGCRDSQGILSRETIVGQHPWVEDVEEELKRLEKEEAQALENYGGAFPPQFRENVRNDEKS